VTTGIQTKYDGTNFRSRLEAKWAHFFDSVGWEWEYEPFDLNGYIPDFVMMGWSEKLIVEVKPAASMAELYKHTKKIEASGWDGDAMIVGAGPTFGGHEEGSGIISQRRSGEPKERTGDTTGLSVWWWGPAIIADPTWCNARHECAKSNCHKCERSCLISSDGGWTCYRCGVYVKWNRSSSIEPFWALARNATQWRKA
jgi:hypothetical protein